MVKNELMTLLSRLVELVTRLFNERMELARGELQEGASRAGRRATLALAGGLTLAVGVGFLGAAAVEALAPLLGNRALRLTLVALPFVAVGAWLVLRAARGFAGAAAPNDRDHDGDEGERQKSVRPAAQPIAAHQPHHQQ
jgi:hypothetical protein